jgi:hypothetical protein
MAHKSGAIQSQLLIALRYLGFVSEAGRPTDSLKRLVAQEGTGWKVEMRKAMEESYGFVFGQDFDLGRATTHQAEELFQSTGASGETVRRSMSFFLAAAKDCGIRVSPYIKPHGGKKSIAKRPAEAPTLKPEVVSLDSQSRVTKKLELRSGGKLQVELSVNLFDLDSSDRTFIFSLIDRLREYEQATRNGRPKS